MCTFKDEQTVMVCDVAIGQVRERLQERFGEIVHYTAVKRQGTLVQIPSTIDAAQFQSMTREAIEEAQHTRSQSRSTREKGGQRV